MSKHDNSDPAFPHIDSGCGRFEAGMTLRDYFAAKAMAAMIHLADSTDAKWHDFDMLAVSAYRQADAMLEARAK